MNNLRAVPVVTALRRLRGAVGEIRTSLFLFYACVALIGAMLVYMRFISDQFTPDTFVEDHPFREFVAVMALAGLVWMGFIRTIPKLLPDQDKDQNKDQSKGQNTRSILWMCVGVGFALRIMFLGSTPIYENDWNRYLWDGAVTAQGINPYIYSPHETLTAGPDAPGPVQDLQALSRANNDFADRINYSELTTIYPPVAQAVFGLAALIKPFDLNVLRILFIVIDGFTLWLMVKTLSLYGRAPLWAALYWLNPLVIYAGFNAVHMEIILLPFLLLGLLLVKTRPQWAAVALGVGAAVKLWPLLLAPILFRSVRRDLVLYLRCAFIVAAVFLLLLSPMLLALGENSGLSVYATVWQRSSFVFPLLVTGFENIGLANADAIARLVVASLLTGLSLWLSFVKKGVPKSLPAALLVMTLALFLLSPTGYPWYALWFIIYLPFVPSYSVGFLLASMALYYLRYAFWEADTYYIYTQMVVPLQFGIPLLFFGAAVYSYYRAKAKAYHA